MAHKNSKYCQRTETERLKRPLNMFFARVPFKYMTCNEIAQSNEKKVVMM